MAITKAWLMRFGAARRAAIGESQFVQLLRIPVYHKIPYAPAHRRHVCVWESRLVPVWDMMHWLGIGAAEAAPAPMAAITTFKPAGATRFSYGALAVMAAPLRIDVRDEDACPLPAAGWQQIALSCFSHEGDPTPVLDLCRMFASVSSVVA